MRTDDTEENVLCSWLLSQNVTQEAGMLHFLLRFACVADDGSVEYAWNTGIYKGMSVASGMYNSGQIIEQYADVLAKWEKDIFAKLGAIDNIKKDIENSRKLKLLKTITLEEDVTSISIEFDKRIDEFVLFMKVGFLQAESKALAARVKAYSPYLFYDTISMTTEQRRFYAHFKIVADNVWETMFFDDTTPAAQGLSDSNKAAKISINANGMKRLPSLNIFLPNVSEGNAMKAGSTIEIWGHEVDESV
jgi:hypothetical protein